MTQSEAENMAQLEQIQALKATRDRVLEVKDLMVPVVEQMAAEGNSLARHLVDELQKAEEAMTLANMDAHNFLEERRPMDKTLAARRLSAALGMKIEPSTIESVTEEGLLRLTDGEVFVLAGGNAVYKGPVMGDTVEDFRHGYWIRNGKPWNLQPGERIRPLPGKSKHIFE